MAAHIQSVHAGRAAPLRGRPEERSAIDKRAVEGVVRLGRFGLDGDVQANRRNHGGPFKAVCGYCAVYYGDWQRRFQVTMPPGAFGENFHLAGLTDEEVCVGDLYRAGSATLRVTGPRGPCHKLAAHWGVKGLHLAVREERKTGFYMAVVEAGEVRAGDELSLLERPLPQWNLVEFWRYLDGVPVEAGDPAPLLACPSLDPGWAPKLLLSRERRAETPTPGRPAD